MSNPDVEEADLIRRAQANDTDSFCILAERYGRRIHLLAIRYCRNPDDAEDLSQDVWLKAYRALGSFRSESSFYTWLRRIAVNTFLNYQRANSSWTRNSQELDCELSLVQSAEPIYNRILFDNVMHALDELTPSQRLMFLLRHYEGMSYDEIASLMHCSSGTAKKAVWRALEKLRVKLTPEPDLSEDELTHWPRSTEGVF